MSSTYKVFVDKMGGTSAADYIGSTGELFYNPADGALRVSDGVTAGGTPLNTPTTAVAYRGFYASYGSFYGDDPSVNQIIISRNQGMRVGYDSSDTNNDDLHAIGLAGSDMVVALNLYGDSNQKGLSAPVVARFVKAFIDSVLFDGNVVETDVERIKTNFYSNIDTLVSTKLPANALYNGFEFVPTISNWYSQVTLTGGTSPATINIYADNQQANGYIFDGVVNGGAGYVVGDVINVPGTSFGLDSPANDLQFTVDNVGPNGEIVGGYAFGAGIDYQWPYDSIDDGGNDQYDTGNYLNTNYANDITYHNGVSVYGSSAVGGGDYVVLYKNSVFAFVTTNANITDFYYSGGMGADGSGDKVETALFGHESTQNTEYVDEQGNLIVADSSEQTVYVPAGGTHLVPNMSGLILVNDHYDGGVEMWLVGSGNGTSVLVSSTKPSQTGTVQEDYSINGYSWTNTSNLNGPFTFTVVKTRNGA